MMCGEDDYVDDGTIIRMCDSSMLVDANFKLRAITTVVI